MHELFRAGDRVQRKTDYANETFGPDNTEQFEVGVVQPNPAWLSNGGNIYVCWGGDPSPTGGSYCTHLSAHEVLLIERCDAEVPDWYGEELVLVSIFEVGSDMRDGGPVVWEDTVRLRSVSDASDWVEENAGACVGAQVEPGYTQDFVAVVRDSSLRDDLDQVATVAFTVTAPFPTPEVTVL